MNFITKYWKGIVLSLCIAIPSHFLGKAFPLIGGPVIAILLGMLINNFFRDRASYDPGIKFVSKKILQYAVILLGFGLNLNVILETGAQSLPIILVTISIALIISYILHKAMRIPTKISTLVGVGSSICGGSAVAACAPVIDADDEEVAQAISVIFFYNILAAIIFHIWVNSLDSPPLLEMPLEYSQEPQSMTLPPLLLPLPHGTAYII